MAIKSSLFLFFVMSIFLLVIFSSTPACEVLNRCLNLGLGNTTKILGRLQGVEANSALNGTNFQLGASLIFDNGGTLEIQGTIKTQLAQREFSVVGGTGKFRYAQGFVSVIIVTSDGINLTFKFTVTIRSHLPIFKQLFGGL
ncbi:hypothetical protein SUGI_0647730 [Cryptomeria japonica]|nr:hypothetical protein SUGI_0647730 [Cryptomeria japonica]